MLPCDFIPIYNLSRDLGYKPNVGVLLFKKGTEMIDNCSVARGCLRLVVRFGILQEFLKERLNTDIVA